MCVWLWMGGILAFLALRCLSFLYLGYQQIQAAERKHSSSASFDSDCQTAQNHRKMNVTFKSHCHCVRLHQHLSVLLQELWTDESDCTLVQTILFENVFLFESFESSSSCSAALQTFKSYVLNSGSKPK